ncbi:MAG: biotin transporter BioY [Oscillospiraceae bacterium]|nr:biotin transporter BioY [Oscillospiraceae bacterium]
MATQTATVGKKPAFSVLDLCLVAMFAALMAICSWIAIPAPPPFVPFTLQTFGVFCALELLGGKRGFFSVLVFVLLGAAGAPVFANFSGGMGVLLGTTGGYIIGFLLTAGLYWVMETALGQKLWVRIAALIGGLALCYAFGTIWFMIVYARSNPAIGAGTALMWCVIPFLLPDGLKMALAIGISTAVKKRVKL